MKKTLFIMLVCFTFYHCRYNSRAMANDESRAPSPSFEPGKCYAKCLMPDITVYDTMKTIIYTGNPKLEDVTLEKVTLEVKLTEKEWKKVKTTANCLSANPDDCEVWCQVDVPAETITYMVLQDTLQTKNFRIQETYKVKKVIKGGYSNYTEVLCSSQITSAHNIHTKIFIDKVKLQP